MTIQKNHRPPTAPRIMHHPCIMKPRNFRFSGVPPVKNFRTDPYFLCWNEAPRAALSIGICHSMPIPRFRKITSSVPDKFARDTILHEIEKTRPPVVLIFSINWERFSLFPLFLPRSHAGETMPDRPPTIWPLFPMIWPVILRLYYKFFFAFYFIKFWCMQSCVEFHAEHRGLFRILWIIFVAELLTRELSIFRISTKDLYRWSRCVFVNFVILVCRLNQFLMLMIVVYLELHEYFMF